MSNDQWIMFSLAARALQIGNIDMHDRLLKEVMIGHQVDHRSHFDPSSLTPPEKASTAVFQSNNS